MSQIGLGNGVHGYTDASGKGIGIVVGNKWQRWLFNQNSDLLPRSPRTNEIDPTWAELLGVCMFLVTELSAHNGYQSCRMVLYSDSVRVVGMFEGHADIHPSLWGLPRKERERCRGERCREVMRRIGGLMTKQRIEVVVKWVPTNANPADGPSRGRRLLEEMRWGYGAHVPDDLVGLLVSV